MYNPDKDIAEEISNTYGISEEGLLDILEDNQGNIWLTTLKRIIRYNPKSHASNYYSTADGILVSAFFKNATLKLRSGELLFGGNNGLCLIDPALQAINTGRSASQYRQSVAVFVGVVLYGQLDDAANAKPLRAKTLRLHG